MLEGHAAGERVVRLSAEQAELARLRARLAKAERRLTRTEVALDIMGKAHAYAGDLGLSRPLVLDLRRVDWREITYGLWSGSSSSPVYHFGGRHPFSGVTFCALTAAASAMVEAFTALNDRNEVTTGALVLVPER